MSVETRIDSVACALSGLKRRLEEMGYVFRDPHTVLSGPVNGIDTAIDRLKREVGPIPLALEAFYRRIGSVNFLGEHPEWEGCDFPDAVFVYPVTVALEELDEFLDRREEYTEAFGGFRVPIAPDYYHKEDVSGGMWYGIALPDESEDPILLEEWHETTFLNYLELCVKCAGFPGLEDCEGEHNWPVEELTRGL